MNIYILYNIIELVLLMICFVIILTIRKKNLKIFISSVTVLLLYLLCLLLAIYMRINILTVSLDDSVTIGSISLISNILRNISILATSVLVLIQLKQGKQYHNK